MKPIPLTPTSGGGLCIPDSALQPADIIVSAGIGAVSTAIRYGTASDVSHAALYIGDGEVIEAIGPGVMERPLNKSLDDHSLAVAYRARGMTPSAAAIIVHFAEQWKGKKYDTVGAAAAGARNPFVCVVVMGIAPCAAARAGKFKSSDKFYCSQLVLEAYRRAGVSFITQDPNTSQPEDMVTAYSRDKLLYVGHLVSTKAERRASSA
jgi:cell wall-associated NlpC family hydrolase